MAYLIVLLIGVAATSCVALYFVHKAFVKHRFLNAFLKCLAVLPGLAFGLQRVFKPNCRYWIRVWGYAGVVLLLWFVFYCLVLDIVMVGWRRYAGREGWLTFAHIFWLACLGVIVSTGISLVQPFMPHVRTIDLHSPLVPREADGYSVALISDLHLGGAFTWEVAERVTRLCNERHPDVLIHAGDLIERAQVPWFSDVEASVEAIAAHDGKFAVLGNHDLPGGESQFMRIHGECGFQVLGASSGVLVARPQRWLEIHGVDDENYSSGKKPAIMPPQPREDVFSIIVYHRPKIPEWLDISPYQLLLGGHTHGGQIFPFTIFTTLISAYAPGKFYDRPDGCSVYISPGIGCQGPPMRFLTRPEITMFVFHHADE